jgi:drug/metabolite transporter (DMT)-like permease
MEEKWKVFWVMLAAVLLAAIGEALSAKGMKASDPQSGLLAQLRTVAGDWHVWTGIALMIGYVLLYTYTLSLADLSLALPLSAASYLIGAFLSKYYLHEDVKPGRWIGTLIIIAGVMVVAFTGFSGDTKK